MTLALYRKYRPRSFSELIGQEHVTEPLSQALRTGRLHHAYLFSGPRGCGKTSSARILARSLNCEKGPTPDPCGECDSCRALAPDGAGSIDVIEIDAASHGGVDDARDLRERAFFAPVSSRFKIYIIDEAHMVSSAGFNALLKLVEEPPEYVKFVFATTEPEKVLGTIKSRTHHYPFRLIPPSVVRPYLEQLSAAEGVKVEPPVFPLVVRAGGGSMRDALSVLDQLIAGAGPEGVTYPRALALLGVTDIALIDEVCDALAAGDGASVYTTIDRVAEAGHDARRFAGDLLERLRNLIILQQVPDAITKGLLDGSADELERMAEQAQRFGPATLSRMADIVHTGLTDMRGTTAPRLVLELIAARMLLPGADDSTNALLARMERMERRLTLGDSDDSVRATAPPPVRSQPAAGGAAPSSTVAPTSVAAPASTAASTGAALAPGTPPSASGTALTDAVPPGVVSPAAVPPSAGAGSRGGAASPADPVSAVAPVSATGSVSTTGAVSTMDAASAGNSDIESPADVQPDAASMHAVTTGDPAPHVADVEAPSDAPRSTAPGAIDAAAVRRIWDEVLSMIRRKSQREAAVVRDANVRDVDGTTLVLIFKYPFHAEHIAGSPGHLQDALYEILGIRFQIRCEVAGQASGPAIRPQSVPPVRPSVPATAPIAAATAQQTSVTEPASDEEWPTTATLGGSGADGGVAAPAPAQATGPGTKPGTKPRTSAATKSTGPGRAAARAAAGGRSGAAGGSTGTATRDDTWAGAGADEPPYDPEFDPPVADATQHVGFDPGDEPADDETGTGDRPSSEQQALDLLRETLGAEKIG